MERHEKLKYLSTLSDQELYKKFNYTPPEELDREAVSTIVDKVGLWDKKELIYALLIGDGSLNPYGTLTLEHGIQQKAYVQYKHILLKNAGFLSPTSQVKRVLRLSKDGDKCYISWRMFTISAFKKERELFYHKKTKCLPPDFLNVLTPGILAFWFMDDGSRENSPLGINLDVSCFSDVEQAAIQRIILERFDVDTTLQSRNTGGRNIKLNFKVRNILNFLSQIKPFFIPTLLYKLPVF